MSAVCNATLPNTPPQAKIDALPALGTGVNT
jgi:hypothetical protein